MKGTIKLCKFKHYGYGDGGIRSESAMLVVESSDGKVRSHMHLSVIDLLKIEGAVRALVNKPFNFNGDPPMADIEIEVGD